MPVSSRKLAVKGVPVLVPLGSHAGKPSLPLGRPFTLVGSRHRAHLHLLSRTVSKSHAAIISTEGGLYIRDLASRERVFVNNKKVQEGDLRDGDILRIGSFNFKYTDPLAKSRPKDARRAPAGVLHVDGSQIPLPLESRTLVIGRRPTCDVPLMETSASTIHAILFEINGKRYIRDLNSRTGTFVNGALIHQGLLNDGDTIKVGDTQMRYTQEQAPAEEPEIPKLESLGDVEELSESGPVAQPESPLAASRHASDENAPIPLAGEEPETGTSQEQEQPAVFGSAALAAGGPQSSVLNQDAADLDKEDRHLLVSTDLHQEKLSGSGSFADVAADAEEGEDEEAHAPLDLDWWPEQGAATVTPAPAHAPQPQPAAPLEPAAPDDLIPLAGEEEIDAPELDSSEPPSLTAPTDHTHVVTSSGAIPLEGEVVSAASEPIEREPASIPTEPEPVAEELEPEPVANEPEPEPIAQEPEAQAEPEPIPFDEEPVALEPESEPVAEESEAQAEPIATQASFNAEPESLAASPEEDVAEAPAEFEIAATHAEPELPEEALHVSEAAAPSTPTEVDFSSDEADVEQTPAVAEAEDVAAEDESEQSSPPVELAPETVVEEPVAPESLPLELASELVPAPDPQEVQEQLAGEVAPGATVAPEVIEEPAEIAIAEQPLETAESDEPAEPAPPIESHVTDEWPTSIEVEEESAELLPEAEPTPESAQALEEAIDPVAVSEADEDLIAPAESDVAADLSDTTFGKAVEEFAGKEIGPLVDETPAQTEVTATAPVDVTEPRMQSSVASDEDAIETTSHAQEETTLSASQEANRASDHASLTEPAPAAPEAPAEPLAATTPSASQPLSDDAAADLLSAESELVPLPDFSDLLGEDELTGDPMVDNAAAFLAHEKEAKEDHAPRADTSSQPATEAHGPGSLNEIHEGSVAPQVSETISPAHEQESVLTAPSTLLPHEQAPASVSTHEEQQVPTAILPEENPVEAGPAPVGEHESASEEAGSSLRLVPGVEAGRSDQQLGVREHAIDLSASEVESTAHQTELTAQAADLSAVENEIAVPAIAPTTEEIELTAPMEVSQAVQPELDAPADEIAIEVVPPAQSAPPIETSIAAAEVAAAEDVQEPGLDELLERGVHLEEAAGERKLEPTSADDALDSPQIDDGPIPVVESAAPISDLAAPVAEPPALIAEAPAPIAKAPAPEPPESGLPRGSVQDLLAGMTRDAGSYLGGMPLVVGPVVPPGMAPATIKVKQDLPKVAPPPTPAPIGRVASPTQAPSVPPLQEEQAPPIARREPSAPSQPAPPRQARTLDKHAELPPADLDELPELFDDGAALDAIPDDLDAISDETDVLKPAPAAPVSRTQETPPARAPQAAPPRGAPMARGPQVPAPPARAAQAPPRAPSAPPAKPGRKPPQFLSPPPAKQVSSPFDGLDMDDEMDDIITSLPEEPDEQLQGMPTNVFDGLAASDEEPAVDAFSLLPLPANDPLMGGGKVNAPSPAQPGATGLAPADPLAAVPPQSRPARGSSPARPQQPPAPRAPQAASPRAAQPSPKRAAQQPSALDDVQPLPQRQGPPPAPEKKRKKWKFFGVFFLLLSLGGAAGAWLQWPYRWQASGSLQFAGLEKLTVPRQRGFLAARSEELLSADVLAHAAQLYRDHAPATDNSSIDPPFVEPLVRNAKFNGNALSLEHMGRDPQAEKTKIWALLTALYEANRYRITDADNHAARLKETTATLDADKAEMQAIKDRLTRSEDRAKAQQALKLAEQTLASKQAAVDQITQQIKTLQSQSKGDSPSRAATDPDAYPQMKDLSRQIALLEARLAVVPSGDATPLAVTKNILAEYQQQIQLAQDGRAANSPLNTYLSTAMKAHDAILHAVATFDERQRMQALVSSKEPQNKQLANTLSEQAAKSGAEMTQQIKSAIDEVEQAAPAPASLAEVDRTVIQGISRKVLLIQAASDQLANSYVTGSKDFTAQTKKWEKDHDALVAQRDERRKELAMQAAAADAAALVQSSDDQARLARVAIEQRHLATATQERDKAESELKFAQTKLAEFSGPQENLAADNLRLTQLTEQSQQLEGEIARANSAEPAITPVALASADQSIALQELDPTARMSTAVGIAVFGFALFLILWRLGRSPAQSQVVVRTVDEQPLPQLPDHGAPVF